MQHFPVKPHIFSCQGTISISQQFQIQNVANNTDISEVLGLDLRLYPNKRFRFFDPTSNEILRSYEEAEQARSLEHQARLEAEAIALQERLIALPERIAKQEAEALLKKYRDRFGDIGE